MERWLSEVVAHAWRELTPDDGGGIGGLPIADVPKGAREIELPQMAIEYAGIRCTLGLVLCIFSITCSTVVLHW